MALVTPSPLQLHRYPFPVPEWTRMIWTSTAARQLWEHRLQQIFREWAAIERGSVGTVRQAARLVVANAELLPFTQEATHQGRIVQLLEATHQSGMYSAARQEGPLNAFNVVLADTLATATVFLAAYKANDEVAIGELLGYPPCCIQHYQQHWVKEQWRDPTWPMAANEAAIEPITNGYRVTAADSPLEANILLRWAGIRFVPHLPCSLYCKATVALGQKLRELVTNDEADQWKAQLLGASVEWSALHGIAEIRHPLFKISSKTDAVAEQLVVRRYGSVELEEAATGNVFPYRIDPQPKPLRFIRHESAADNGFSHPHDMEMAHAAIVSFVQQRVGPVDTVIDLGCGNGRLLRQLGARQITGVEMDPKRLPTQSGNWLQGDLFDLSLWDGMYDLALIMPGRLLEQDYDPAFITTLHKRARTVVAYAYGDWQQKFFEACSRLGRCEKVRNDPFVWCAIVRPE